MKSRFVLVVVALVAGFGGTACSFLQSQTPAVPPLTDLKIGPVYVIAYTELVDAVLPDGSVVRSRDFYFRDHAVRLQAVPVFDGRSRQVIRIVTNDPKLPVGTLRLIRVIEKDPDFEGLKWGDYLWQGIAVEFNPPRLKTQRHIPRTKVRG